MVIHCIESNTEFKSLIFALQQWRRWLNATRCLRKHKTNPSFPTTTSPGPCHWQNISSNTSSPLNPFLKKMLLISTISCCMNITLNKKFAYVWNEKQTWRKQPKKKKKTFGLQKNSTKTGLELGFSFSNSANVPFEHKYKYVEHRVHLTGIC